MKTTMKRNIMSHLRRLIALPLVFSFIFLMHPTTPKKTTIKEVTTP